MIVFSSPAAKKRSGRRDVASCPERLSHTPWCRWITSTGGTLPSARRRFGVMRTIQPSKFGLGMPAMLVEMLFWPAFTVSGPNSKWSRWAPGSGPWSATRLVFVTVLAFDDDLSELLEEHPAASSTLTSTTTTQTNQRVRRMTRSVTARRVQDQARP